MFSTVQHLSLVMRELAEDQQRALAAFAHAAFDAGIKVLESNTDAVRGSMMSLALSIRPWWSAHANWQANAQANYSSLSEYAGQQQAEQHALMPPVGAFARADVPIPSAVDTAQ